MFREIILFSSLTSVNRKEHCKCSLACQIHLLNTEIEPPSSASTPRFQIFIPTKIFQPHCLEDGRITLRCNLNLRGLLRRLTYDKLVFLEEDFQFVFTPDPCKMKNKLIPTVNGQKETFVVY